MFLKIELCFAVIGEDCVSVGINVSPKAIVRIDTHPTNKTLLLAIYFLVGDFAILFSFPRVLSS